MHNAIYIYLNIRKLLHHFYVKYVLVSVWIINCNSLHCFYKVGVISHFITLFKRFCKNKRNSEKTTFCVIWLFLSGFVRTEIVFVNNPLFFLGFKSLSKIVYAIILKTLIIETLTCVLFSVDGSWTAWNSYGACDVTCGSGTQTRSRDCINPPPLHGGADCAGNNTESQQCNAGNCPSKGWVNLNELSPTKNYD